MKTKNIVELCKVNLSTTSKKNDLRTYSNLAGKLNYVFITYIKYIYCKAY